MPRYIHELTDWPAFNWDPSALSVRLAEVRHRQGRFVGRMESLGFELRSEALLATLTSDVIKTSEIEGEILDMSQVRSSIARQLGMDIAGLVPSDRAVDGVVEMTLDATQNYSAPLTSERLFSWHRCLFPTGRSGMSMLTVGAWRDDALGPMQVVSGPIGRERVHFEAPSAGRLEGEMRRFLDWFNQDIKIDLVLKAAQAHLWFVTIHPFDDGNGRIARAIADLTLARSEQSKQRFYSVSAQISADRRAYYDALEATQKQTLDITPWMRWFLDCLDRSILGAEAALAQVLKKAKFWEANAGISLNDRQRSILNRLLGEFEGKLTSTKWAKLAKCSHDTALRDIDDLVKRGILLKDPGGGRSTSYSLPE